MRNSMRGTSPILVTAALSVAALLSAVGFSMGNTHENIAIAPQADLVPVEMPSYIPIEDADGNGMPDWQDELLKAGITFSTTTPTKGEEDPLSEIATNIASALYGGYLSLKQYDEYTPSRGEQLGQNVAANIRAPIEFTPHTVNELRLDDDTSSEAVLSYRAGMRLATASMISDELPELDLFARYVQTKDTFWLQRLSAAGERYAQAEEEMLAISVPKDAAPEHLRAVNAVGKYAQTISLLSQTNGDALVAAALLKSQSEAEQELLIAFDALAKYYVRKITN